MSEEKNIVTEIIIGIVVNIIVGAILGLLSFIWNSLEWNNMWLCVVFAIVIFVESVSISIYLLWRKQSYKSYYYSPRKIDYKYTVENNVINYAVNRTVKSNREFFDLDLSREIVVRSNTETLDRINDKFLWTGNSEANLPKGEENVRTIQKIKDKPGVWKYFEVIFNRRIQKGDEIKLNYKWPTIKKCRSSSPFISTITDVPTKNLVFNIDLGKSYAGTKIYIEERRSIDGDNMLSHDERILNNMGRATITIAPHRFRYYIVFWEW